MYKALIFVKGVCVKEHRADSLALVVHRVQKEYNKFPDGYFVVREYIKDACGDEVTLCTTLSGHLSEL